MTSTIVAVGRRLVLAPALLCSLWSTSASAQTCVGDCNGDGQVSINEVIVGVNIGLGLAPISGCAAFDLNGDGMVSVNEVIAAVNNGLTGCTIFIAGPTSTPSRPPTPTATPTQPAVGDVLFLESWERASTGTYSPEGPPPFEGEIVRGDTGDWLVGDTVSSFPEDCGRSPHFVEVVNEGGEKRLRLHSLFSDSDCSDNVFLGPIHQNPPALRMLDIPVTDDLFLSFEETGSLSRNDGCDAVLLHVEFDSASRLSYVLQRGDSWDPPTGGFPCGGSLLVPNPLPIDVRDDSYLRNLVNDSLTAGIGRPRVLTFLSLEVRSVGQATFDNITIFRSR